MFRYRFKNRVDTQVKSSGKKSNLKIEFWVGGRRLPIITLNVIVWNESSRRENVAGEELMPRKYHGSEERLAPG